MESESNMKTVKVIFNPMKTARILFGIDVLLSIISILVWYLPRRFDIHVGKLFNLFYLDNEMNVPTFFSVLLMMTCAILLVIIAIEDRTNLKKYYRHWFFLAFGFFFMAGDDFMMLHEKLMNPMNKLFGINGISYLLTFSWIVPYFLLVVVLAISYFKFIRDLPKKSKLLFMAAAFIYLFGIFGMEMAGGYVKRVYGMETREYVVVSTIEEFLEMSGLIFFIYGLLDHINNRMGKIRMAFGSEKE
jgi:hypothetical protein